MDWGIYLWQNNKGTKLLCIDVDDIILYAGSPKLMKCSKQQNCQSSAAPMKEKCNGIWVSG
jgi:hypothetical protein